MWNVSHSLISNQMKARTKLEKMVVASNLKLSAIAPKAIEWASKMLIEHPAFRTPSMKVTCGDCGHRFSYDGKAKYVVCPHCKSRIHVEDTLKRKFERRTYFSTLEVINGLQVQRVSLLTAIFKKGEPMKTACVEICRLWLNSKGKSALTSKRRSVGLYLDSFNWASPIELKSMTQTHMVISDTYIYPKFEVLPELKRNGFDKKMFCTDCHPHLYLKALLSDPRIETLVKAGHIHIAKYFIGSPTMLDRYWSSLKIAMRNHYIPQDISMWCDTLRLLERYGHDIHSTKYICPNDLKEAHDMWVGRVNRMEMRRREKERIERAMKSEAEFKATKSIYFGIVFSDEDIEVSVLDSIEAYKEEGDAMKHCVFKCSYFDRPDSIILSAHDKSGHRIETVEFSLNQGKVVQCHGRNNMDTDYHERIINLVNSNAHRFAEASKRATA